MCMNTNQNAHITEQFAGYVPAERCIEILFPGNGICLRTFRSLQAMGRIPFLKIGRGTLLNPVEVRAALERTCKRDAE
jgi:hypothetical protein